jgi:DNA-binding beta-propeller fold protein YncE
MDEQRFDAALRALNTGTTRRSGLAAALGVLIGGATGAASAGAASGDGPTTQGPCGNGSARDNRCSKDGQCCTKYCADGECRCKPNWMRCGKNAECCSGACLDGRCDGGAKPAGGRCAENFNCQNGLVCIKGACTKSNKATCTAQNCPGCCQGTVCRVGTTKQVCGAKGGACARCAADKTCKAGVCSGGGGGGVSCTAATCPNGCCQNGTCKAGTSASACGTGGSVCIVCSGATASCVDGACAPESWKPLAQFGSGPGLTDAEFKNVGSPALSADALTLYVPDTGNSRVVVWGRADANSAWEPQEVLGDSYSDANDRFKFPYGAALSTDGLELYISDYSARRISVWTRSSTSGPWQAQTPLGNGGGTNNDQFGTPFSLVLSADKLELYIADTSNARVSFWKRADTSSAWQAQTPVGNGNGSDPDQLKGPAGVAISPDGLKLYIADQENNRISVWARANATAAWQPDIQLGSGLGLGNDQFYYPMDIALSENGLAFYVADRGNNRIDVWTRPDLSSAWEAQTPFGGTAGLNTPGSGPDQFASPYAVALSADGRLICVTDANNYRISVWHFA